MTISRGNSAWHKKIPQGADVSVQVQVLKPVKVLRRLPSKSREERSSGEKRAEAERRVQYEELIERRIVANLKEKLSASDLTEVLALKTKKVIPCQNQFSATWRK